MLHFLLYPIHRELGKCPFMFPQTIFRVPYPVFDLHVSSSRVPLSTSASASDADADPASDLLVHQSTGSRCLRWPKVTDRVDRRDRGPRTTASRQTSAGQRAF